MPSNVSLYGSTTGNVTVSSNNLTTLYSGGGVNIRPTVGYGNANVERFLNVGTDGGNTINNIIANGNIEANGYFIGDGGYLSNIGNAGNANYANFAGEAFDVNVGNVTGIGNIAVINLDGSAGNVLYGNGVFAPGGGGGNGTPGGSNTQVQYNDNGVFGGSSDFTFDNTTNTVSATFFTGTLTTNAQPNITSVGNLTALNIIDNSNANSVTKQFYPNSTTVNANANVRPAIAISKSYWPNASTGRPSEEVFIRYRGNSTSPTTAVNGDRVYQNGYYVYNGNDNLAVASTVVTSTGTIPGAGNLYSGGQYTFTTGNPSGNLLSANGAGAINSIAFNNSGGIVITPATAPNTSLGQSQSALIITNYGSSTTNLVDAGGVLQQRARGNTIAGNLSVQPSDIVGKFLFAGHNGTSYNTTTAATFRGIVDSSYTANSANVPVNLQIIASASNGSTKTSTFYGNGLVNFPNDVNVTGNITVANANVTNTLTLANLSTGNLTVSGEANVNGNIHSNAEVSASSLFANTGIYLTGVSNVLPGIFEVNQGAFRFRNQDPILPAFDFETYSNSSSVGTESYYRARGVYITSPQPVQGGDQIVNENYTVYADSGNTLVSVGHYYVTVTNNDLAGNVDVLFQIDGGSSSTSLYSFNVDQVRVVNDLAVENGNALFNNNMTVQGVSFLGDVSNVRISGGSSGDVLSTDGTGNLSWTPQTGGGGDSFNAFLLMGG